jgi:regulator of sigma E protease
VAHDIGLRTGDRILEVNGRTFERFDQINPSALVAADSLTFTVRREGREQRLVGPANIITRLSRAQNNDQGFGLGYYPPLIGGVQEGSPADSLGIQSGDRIIAIGEDTVRFWQEMSALIQETEGAPVSFRWRRPDSLASADTSVGGARLVQQTKNGLIYEAEAPPMHLEEENRYVLGVMGPTSQMLYAELGAKQVSFGPGEALVAGTVSVWENTRNIVVTLKRVITGRDSFRESLGGPVMIAKVTSQAAQQGAVMFWRLVAILSVTLAVMNILPIPALDGGQLMFLLYEAVTRRRPSVRVRLVAQQVGMILLLGFMAFLIFNDILRL